MRDWVGTGGKAPPRVSHMRPFEAARDFARALELKSWGEWLAYVRGERPDLPSKPANVPADPQACYRTTGWITWGDFLGNNKVAWHQVTWREFETAREFAQSLGLSGIQQWRSWIRSGKKPVDIPSNPEKAYHERWRGWSDWLGNKRTSPKQRNPPALPSRRSGARKEIPTEPRFPPLLHSSRITRKPKPDGEATEAT